MELARRQLERLWHGSGVLILPCVAPAAPNQPAAATPPPCTEKPPFKLALDQRVDQLLGLLPPTGTGGRASPFADEGSSIKRARTPIDCQGKEHTRGVSLVENLFQLGRADVKKKRVLSVDIASIVLVEGEGGMQTSEIGRLRKSQAFSVAQNRPSIIAESVRKWRGLP